MNNVKLYSNGSAVITKEFSLEQKPVKITIPVKKEDLDYVVSSLTILGDVTVSEPPNYTPTNSNPTTLTLDSKNVFRDLAIKLKGAEVEITLSGPNIMKGKLFGIQTHLENLNNVVIERFNISIGNEQGIRQIQENYIQSIKFTDEFVQAEIDKSLTAAFSTIKPDSRNIDLTILPNKNSKLAAISYATPCAAWKTIYQLRINNNKALLEQQAVVDNDTDDDWKDVKLSVITGEPISFLTDIADIRRPTLSKVNVVSDSAIGAVAAEESHRRAGLSPKSLRSASLDSSLESMSASGGRDYYQPVKVEEAEVKESGDFSIFTAPNQATILSRKSAIIGLRNITIDESKIVLLYKPTKNERRPFTSLKFKNPATSLTKGVCEVYVDGDRQGKCILENANKNEEVFLVYALETGVKIFREVSNANTKQTKIKISDSTVYCESLVTQKTTYNVQNNKSTNFQMEMEYIRTWKDSEFKISVSHGEQSSVDTITGCRIGVVLPSNGTLNVTVTESLVQKQTYVLGSWIDSNIVIEDHPLVKDAKIQDVLKLQKVIDSIQREIFATQEVAKVRLEEQNRLINLIPNLHKMQADTCRNELAELETEIKSLKKITLPKLQKDWEVAKDNLNLALSKLKTEWKE
jgi:hypothetical protein